jgi:hypothetical protein
MFQVKDQYATKNEILKRYKHAVWGMIDSFDVFSIDVVLRE